MSVSDEVRQRIDIVGLISRYTPLKKAGSTYKGLCPFHSERTPSFVVFPHSNTWHCFGGCATGGDVFTFLMKKENIEFREALEILAREAGVNLHDEPGDDSHRQRALVYTLNDLAATYFQEVLRDHPAAQPARDYLQRRGIDQATAARFRLGYALENWNALRDHLTAQGYSVEQLLVTGLVKRNEERDSTYDAFRHRVMFPIRDRQARVIGFGGRVLDDSQPKYLNSAETPVFHKSHVIYGIDLAYQAIRDARQVVIVEGYMDVIAAHQFGFANVVACMGTALTPDQLRQLQRLTSDFVLALDADSAGQQATIRGINQARQALNRVPKPVVRPGGSLRLEERLGANLFVASMPAGMDPDDVIRRDPAQWSALIEQKQPLVDFYFTVVAQQFDLASAQGKALAVTELTPLIAELDDEIERQHYLQKLSRLVQVDEATIAGRVHAAAKTGHLAVRKRGEAQTGSSSQRQSARSGTRRNGSAPAPPMEQSAGRAGLEREDYLLANLLREPDLIVWFSEVCAQWDVAPPQTADWLHVENQEIFRALRQYISTDEPWDPEGFQDMLTSHLHGRLAQLMADGAQFPQCTPAELRDDILKVLVRIRIDHLKDENRRITFLIDEAQRNGDRDAAREFTATNNRTLRDLAHLDRTFADLSRVLVAQSRPDQGIKIR